MDALKEVVNVEVCQQIFNMYCTPIEGGEPGEFAVDTISKVCTLETAVNSNSTSGSRLNNSITMLFYYQCFTIQATCECHRRRH